MALYAYSALDRGSAAVRGVLTADSPRHARDQLRERGLLVKELALSEPAATRVLGFRRRASTRQLATFCRELATLLSVGITLSEALGTLAKQQRGRFKETLMVLRSDVEQGRSLSEAMRSQAGVFDDLTLHMVEVGDNSGNLEDVLDKVAEFKEQIAGLKDQVLSALTYPLMVFAVSSLAALFLMTTVVPMLLGTLLEAGRPLPWPTQVLKWVSDFIVHYGLWIGLVVVAAVVGWAALLRSPAGRRAWERLFLKIPILGAMVRKQAVSRLAMVIATLMRTGIVYLRAAEIAAKASGNSLVAQALLTSNQQVQAGADIGRALEQTAVFPPLAIQVFAVGQASGCLEDMLERLSRTYDREVQSLATRLTAMLEPLLILTLAGFVGFILFATLLPILEAGNVL